MKQKGKNIVSLLMAVVMVFSTISLTINHWYCQGKLIDTTLFSTSSCCEVNDCEVNYILTSSCCEHEKVIIHGQIDLQLQKEFKKQFFVNIFLPYVLKILETNTKKDLLINQYTPPNIIIDKLSVYQVYII